MTNNRHEWADLLRQLDIVLELDEPAREPWLNSQHPMVQSRLREMLAQQAVINTADFLGRPAALPGETAVAHSGQLVGPWRLLHELGRGGMAWVWLAERADGQGQRRVALKLPRPGWAPGLAERMARERDILATLEHPHIARLYDAGVDAQSRPWLALAYVQGQPIDQHANTQGLDTAARLALLIQVADAVAYAHARLVVHRDLKPSNILVTAAGDVQLLDFGIAKLLHDHDGPGASALTRVSGRALTPEYASPEQVLGKVLGTASDVYSLGVVAYELLSGQRPYRLKRGTAAELEEAITAIDAPPASSLAQPGLRKALRGDLDAVLARALAREPAQRYPTVAAFAEDLRRHLAGQPVSARSPGLIEQTRRLVQHHRWGVMASIAVATALFMGTTLALWQAREAGQQRDLALANAAQAAHQAQLALAQTRRADDERRLADQARAAAQAATEEAQRLAGAAQAAAVAERTAAQRARQDSQRAAAVQDFLVDIFKTSSSRQADPQKARNVSARELLDIGADKLEGALSQQPAARLQLTDTLSRLYGEMGVGQRSVELAHSSVTLAEQLRGHGSPAHLGALALLLTQQRPTANAANLQHTLAQAEAALAGASGSAQHASLNPGPRRASAQRVDLLLSLAMFHEGNQLQRAHQLAQQATQEAQAAGHAALQAQALLVLGRVMARLGDHTNAVAQLQEGLRRADALAGGHAQGKLPDRVTLAESQMQLLRAPQALAALRLAMAEAEHKEGTDHIDALQTRLRLGAALGSAGQAAEAIALLQPLAQRVRQLGPARELLLSVVLADLCWSLRERGEFGAAEGLLREALAIRDRLRPGSNVSAILREDLASTLVAQGNVVDAAALLQEAQTIRVANHARPGDFGMERLALVRLQLARARDDKAGVHAVVQSLAGGVIGERSPTRAWFGASLGRARVAIDDGDLAAASTQLRHTQAAFERLATPGSYPAIEAPLRLLCARLARRAGRIDEAERQFAQTQAMLVGHLPSSLLRAELAQARAETPLTDTSAVASAATGTPSPLGCSAGS